MKPSEVYRFQALRIRREALAAKDSRAITIINHLLEALPCADNLVSSYAYQLRTEAKSPLVRTLAHELGKATLQGDAFYNIMAEAEAAERLAA